MIKDENAWAAMWLLRGLGAAHTARYGMCGTSHSTALGPARCAAVGSNRAHSRGVAESSPRRSADLRSRGGKCSKREGVDSRVPCLNELDAETSILLVGLNVLGKR